MRSSNGRIFPICLFLAAAAAAAFWHVGRCDFVLYDDSLYVVENGNVQGGITPKAVEWAFTTGHAANWHPLTWLSHMLDVELFGLNPHWHHLVNLLFHVANTLLLFLVFYRMTKGFWQSAFVAALFALHPLHVESVAWIAERKDVLSTFFWMLTMAAYVRYVEHPDIKGRLAVFAFFALGLMAKPMLVTLPFVLLLLDYWPLHRIKPETDLPESPAAMDKPLPVNAGKKKSKKKQSVQPAVTVKDPADDKTLWTSIRPLIIEKVPLFALAATSSVVTFIVQQKGGAVKSMEAFPAVSRIANAAVSYVLYIAKTLWPAGLAVYYPHPGLRPLWQVVCAVLLLAVVSLLVIRAAKKLPCLCVGWLWFAGTLVPVVGIVQVGTQAMADRYTYLPSVGLFVMAAWGIPELLKHWSRRRQVLAASSAVVLSALFVMTWIQTGYWRNSFTLFDHTLEVTSENYLIRQNRGLALSKLGKFSEALEDYDAAIEIHPNVEAFNNRGAAYAKLGDYPRAIADYDRAIRMNPEFALSYNNRGSADVEMGKLGLALGDFDKALELDPEYADAYDNRGAAYAKLGDCSRAIADYDRAIEFNPRHAWAYNGRGAAYVKLGDPGLAMVDYARAIEFNPEYAEAHYNRGILYQSMGRHREAIEDYDRAIEIRPDYAEALTNRGASEAVLGDNARAVSDYDRAIEIDPGYAKAYYNRGVAYGELGNLSGAVSDYDRAISINHEYADAYNNRGVAYAKLGNRKQAVEDLIMAAKLGNEASRNSLRSIGISWH